MSRSGRKRAGPGTANVWNSTLDVEEGALPTQAGEQDDWEEPRGGGDKGLDAETGSGGYGGDTVQAGIDEADAEPERPLDAEIRGDPRTHEGESYPDQLKRADPGQRPIGQSELDEDMSED